MLAGGFIRTITICVWMAPIAAIAQVPRIRPAFEVASIRPAEPTGRLLNGLSMEDYFQTIAPFSMAPVNGRRVDMKNRSLRSLIAIAYEVRRSQVSGPGWLDDLRFNIAAIIPEDAAATDAPKMLQSLLVERFGLKSHREEQQQSGYVLVVGKNGPKLKQSAPINRSAAPPDPATMQARIAEMASKRPSTPITPGARRSSYTHITMERLAGVLTPLVEREVVDRTGLQGDYEVVLEMVPSSPDEDPVVSVLIAIESLGLKLQSERVPVEVLVVDAMSKVPTEN